MSSKYQMWLTFNGGREKIRFPVLPETFNIKKGILNTSVSVQGLGEVIIKGDPAAIIISFSSFFPATPFPGVQFEELTPPYVIKDRLTLWQKSERPVQILVTGTTVNLFCVIDDFTYFEKGGDVGTLHYSLTLREYKEVAARQVKINAPPQRTPAPVPAPTRASNPVEMIFTPAPTASVPAPTPTRTDNRVQEKTYTVVKGDTLWSIAARHLGSGSRYTEIASLNADIIKNPSLIYPGQTLRLPS